MKTKFSKFIIPLYTLVIVLLFILVILWEIAEDFIFIPNIPFFEAVTALGTLSAVIVALSLPHIEKNIVNNSKKEQLINNIVNEILINQEILVNSTLHKREFLLNVHAYKSLVKDIGLMKVNNSSVWFESLRHYYYSIELFNERMEKMGENNSWDSNNRKLEEIYPSIHRDCSKFFLLLYELLDLLKYDEKGEEIINLINGLLTDPSASFQLIINELKQIDGFNSEPVHFENPPKSANTQLDPYIMEINRRFLVYLVSNKEKIKNKLKVKLESIL